MAEMKLPSEKMVLLDDEDTPLVSGHSWFESKQKENLSYAVAELREEGRCIKKIFMHHKIIGDPPVGYDTDHKNGNGLDNRRSNLRFCTRSQNNANRKIPKNNTSGYKGVSWSKVAKKWCAQIGINGMVKNLGYFDDIKDAARTYDAKAAELFGEFARPNFC